MKNILKIVWIIIRSILIFIVIGALSTATVKHIQKAIKVENFKAKGIYQEDISTEDVKFYKIESNEEIPTFIEYEKEILPGGPGDIIVSTQATLINPLVSGLVSFFAGGHAAICLDDYRDFDIASQNDGFSIDRYSSIEATGLDEGENLSSIEANRTYWAEDTPFTEVIGLRVKMSESERKEVISMAVSLLGDPYNYSFIFDTTNKSYCSDLVSKAYKKIGVNLNKDDFSTSIYDLIVSGEAYISYYHYFDSKGVKHIYYLG